MGYSREIKVGAFVIAGLGAMGLVISLIGQEQGLFRAKHQYSIVFDDVQGLKPGSPVRMGGVDVGTVKGVDYADERRDPKLYVTIAVARDAASRIRADSVASITGKGMLGDKMVVITVGDAAQPEIPPGGAIRSAEGGGLEAMMDRVGAIGEKADRVMTNLESTTGTLADEKFRADLATTLHSVAGILEKVNEGDGYVSRLLRDPAEADRLSSLVGSLEQTSRDLRGTMSHANAVLNRVEQGPGFTHDLIYGDGPGAALERVGTAADEVAVTLKGIREGSGPARSLLYGDEGSASMMANLDAMSTDLRQIVADVRAGRGTLGALLVDPSVYEDVKLLLGNVERNRSLRALVRYSIQRDEPLPGVEVRDPGPAPTAPASGAAAGRGGKSSPE